MFRRSFARRRSLALLRLRSQRDSNLSSRHWRTLCPLTPGYFSPCERRRGITREPLVPAFRRLLQNLQISREPLRFCLETNPQIRALLTCVGGVDLIYLDAECLGHRDKFRFYGRHSGSGEYAVHHRVERAISEVEILNLDRL